MKSQSCKAGMSCGGPITIRDWIAPTTSPADIGVTTEPSKSQRRPTWWMRRDLELESTPVSATLTIVCLGYYELYVNGKRVGDEPLAPSLTKLDKRGFAIEHELSGVLKAGLNCIALWTSTGWYVPHQFRVHEQASPLLGLELTLDDAPCSVGTDWVCRPSNRLITCAWGWNQFGGEEVDARKAMPDWNQVGIDLTDWQPARIPSPPPIAIVPRNCPPNRIGETYQARFVRSLPNGVFEVDFGTCLSGWVDIRFGQLDKDQAITLRFRDLPADTDRDKDQSYNQFSIYHARGDGADRFVNKFNYAGFRYMTIEGMATPPERAGMKAMLVETAMERTGHFRCSNELYNRIHDLNLHTLRCLDLGGCSVDCPHRERNGYGADGQTSIPAYLYMFDSADFLRKWLVDWCDVYEPETGRIPLTAPARHPQEAPAWGAIVVPLAWKIYTYFGDATPMTKAFDVILGHLRHLQGFVADGVMRKELMGGAFHGDWVAVDRGMETDRTPDQPMRELFNSCYLIYVWELFVKICNVLDRPHEAREAQGHIAALREGIHREFYKPDEGLYLMPEQAYQAMPLLAGVVPDGLRPAIRAKLLGLIEERGWHMDTGLPGTTLLLELLEELGEHEVIGRIHDQEDYPGFGYMLAQGATAIWEQWNGYWSQIHSCFAGPAAWFYSGLAGITPDESRPGFAHIFLAPAFLKGLDFVEADFDSAQGRIESKWRREPNGLSWSIVVPAGGEATVSIPLANFDDVSVNGRPWTGERTTARNVKGQAITSVRLTSGAYLLRWTE